jgi:long-chain acyl-CoA synthetase
VDAARATEGPVRVLDRALKVPPEYGAAGMPGPTACWKTREKCGPTGISSERMLLKIEHQTLRDLLTAQSRRFEKKIFLEFGALKCSYADLDERTDRVATGLNRLGLGYGDRVALLLPNGPESVFFILGAPKIGAIPVLIDPFDADAGTLLAQCRAVAAVTDSRFMELQRAVPGIRNWILTDGQSFAEAPFYGLSHGAVLGFWPDLAPDDAALIAYTRGTRGPHKAVMLSHRSLISNCLQILQPYRIDWSDRFYCAIPLQSAFAIVLLLLAPCLVGGTCVLRYDLSREIARDIQENRATIIVGPPALYDGIVSTPNFPAYDLSSLRLAVCSHGAIDREILRRFEEPHDVILVEAYAVTEATALSCTNPYTGLRKPESIGLPFPGQECRIVDEQGRELTAGERGAIVVRGPNIMIGYFGEEDASARALRGGWLHTGDYGRVDSDGYYYLVPES